ncbi:MAG TPA: aspartate aminotransferase family protein [Wenzhouxiangella sp.]
MQKTHLFDTYARMPVAFERGEGVWLIDQQGHRYLDALSGIAVCSLGHAHPRLTQALCDQAHTLWHTANIAHLPLQEQLASELCEISGLDRVFLANSGLEAVECAIKIARRHAHQQQIEQPAILVASESFHGRSLASLSASGSPAIQAGFGPLMGDFVRVPFGDAQAARAAFESHPNLVAALIEPVQGEGGVRVAPAGYLQSLRALCDQHNALLMLDEIQCGMARTGKWFAFQHDPGLKPDVLTVAKALGNGMPIGACLATESVAQLLPPGSHGTTFGGNPLACRVGLEVLAVMRDENILERADRMGERLLDGLRTKLTDHPHVIEVRGRGLMVGVEFDCDVTALKQAALDAGVIINVTRSRIVRLLPPLIIEPQEVDQIIDIIHRLVETHFGVRQSA